jgi:hypothetical protein
VLLWFDAGNKITESLEPLINVVKTQGIYSALSWYTVRIFTHPKTLEFFSIPGDSPMLEKTPRNAAMLGFDLDSEKGMNFVKEFARLALIKDCIAPEGSSRANHRQDQAVMTVLYYNLFGDTPTENNYISFNTHNDIG